MKSVAQSIRFVSLLSLAALATFASSVAKAQTIEVGTLLRHGSQPQAVSNTQVTVSGPNFQVTYGQPVAVTQVVYPAVQPVVVAPAKVYERPRHHFLQRPHHSYYRPAVPVYYQKPVQYVPAAHYVPVQYVTPAPIVVKPAPIYQHRPHWDNNAW